MRVFSFFVPLSAHALDYQLQQYFDEHALLAPPSPAGIQSLVLTIDFRGIPPAATGILYEYYPAHKTPRKKTRRKVRKRNTMAD